MTELEYKYELYKLLDENDYVPSEESMLALKEDIENGNIDILDSSVINFNENLTFDSMITTLAENNYIDNVENEKEILKEEFDNDYLFLTEGFFRKWKNKRRAKARMKDLWKEGKAGPQVKKAQKEGLENEVRQ